MKERLTTEENEVPPHKETICAVYVTYHPDANLPERMGRIARQVGHIVIVDNHSDEEAVHMLRALCQAENAELIENKENLGIAAALNQGVTRAIELGYSWALTLDQDSWPEPRLVDALDKIYASHPEREKVKMIGSNYILPATGHMAFEPGSTTPSFIETECVITSGSLMSLKAFEEVGPFREDFFIDQVDDEYCLRLRSYGYKVLISSKPLMIHSCGNVSIRKHLWREVCSNHSPLRRYYITRNRLILYRIYACKEPYWVKHSLRTMLGEIRLIILCEDRKIKKLLAILLGILHAILGRMGRIQNRILER